MPAVKASCVILALPQAHYEQHACEGLRWSYIEADAESACLALLITFHAVANVGDGLEVGIREDCIIVSQQRRALEGR